MQISALPSDVLFFFCGHCSTELSVPVLLQGVEGPCPHCGQKIQAPVCPVPVSPHRVYLPPLDKRHDPPAALPEPTGLPSAVPALPSTHPGRLPPHSSGDPLQDRQEWQEQPVRNEVPALWRNLPGEASAGLLQMEEARAKGLHKGSAQFQAKHSIPAQSSSGFPEGTTAGGGGGNQPGQEWAARNPTPGFRPLRILLLLVIGGLAAGLGLFLKERNWVPDLPWKSFLPTQEVEAAPEALPANQRLRSEMKPGMSLIEKAGDTPGSEKEGPSEPENGSDPAGDSVAPKAGNQVP